MAPIRGDIEDIIGIHTRMIKIYRADSKFAETMQTLKEAIVQLYCIGEKLQAQTLISLASMVFEVLEKRRYSLNSESGQLAPVWTDVIEEINPTLKGISPGKVLPIRIKDVLEDNVRIFDASEYWMNWQRLAREDI